MPLQPVLFFSDTLDATVQNCVDCYTSDWVVVKRRYHNFSSSVRPREELEDRLNTEAENTMRHEFEVDDTPPDGSPEYDNVS